MKGSDYLLHNYLTFHGTLAEHKPRKLDGLTKVYSYSHYSSMCSSVYDTSPYSFSDPGFPHLINVPFFPYDLQEMLYP